jgi:molybdopterin converting factor small subunit
VSMKVAIQFEAQLRQVAGTGKVDIDVPEGSNLMAALQQFTSSANNGLHGRLFTQQGMLQASVLVFVNDQPVPSQSANGHLLNADDEILLLPPISGG